MEDESDYEERDMEQEEDYGTEDEQQPPAKRRREADRNWIVKREFEDKPQAVESVKNEKCWSTGKRYYTKEGAKVQYRCNLVKKSGEQCPAGVMLLFHAEKETVSLYRTEDSHNHGNKEAGKGIPETIKEAIVDLFESGVKTPKAILAALHRRDLQPRPTRRQLQNFLQQYKRNSQGPASMDLGQFDKWYRDRSRPDPADKNQPYVVAFSSEIERDGDGKEQGKIRLFMTTPLLLEKLSRGIVYTPTRRTRTFGKVTHFWSWEQRIWTATSTRLVSRFAVEKRR